jgi:hypothetical protein
VVPGACLKLAVTCGGGYFALMNLRKRENALTKPIFDPGRRRVLGGLAGAGWLAGTGTIITGCSGGHVLRVPLAVAEAKLFRAIAPALLSGLLPTNPAEREDGLNRLVDAISISVSSLSSDGREQLARLLAALDFRLTRWLLTDLWKPLHEASVDEINGFLDNWRHSPTGRFNFAYRTLTKLVCSNWYQMPRNYAQSGYPGPPAWALRINKRPEA